MRHEVLVVEDDDDLRELVRQSLEELDAEVCEAATAATALQAVRARPVSVAVVDLDVPDLQALHVLGELRRLAPDLHLVVVSGATDRGVRMRCFAAGADDYLAKPFSAEELAARVAAALRRRRAAGDGQLRFDDLALDLMAREVRVAGERMALDPLEFDLLAFLALHPGRTYSGETLRAAVWGASSPVESPPVSEHVRHLRSKLDSHADRGGWITFVPDGGYRFEPRPGLPRRAEPLTSAVLDAKGAVQLFVDSRSTIVGLSDGALDFFGALRPEELVGRPVLDLVSEASRGTMVARAEQARSGDWPNPEEIVVRRLDGAPEVVEIVSKPVALDGIDAAEISLWPVGSRSSQQLQALLTGITSEVADAVIVTTPDLHIRSLNPAAEALYGWAEQEVRGRRLHEVIPWVGDERMIESARRDLFSQGTWTGKARQQCRNGQVVRVLTTVSSLRDPRGRPFSLVIVNRPASDRPAPERSGIRSDELRRAIEDGSIVPYYQPIVRLHDRRVLGVEALARWRQPDGTVLAAGQFVPAIEQSDLIVALGRSVLRQACEHARRWEAGGRPTQVSVNVSARQLLAPDFVQVVEDCLRDHRLPPGALWLEVTETSLVEDIDGAERALRDVVAAGVRLTIDDFGTGWASLTYLRRFPVSGLKIDRSFVEFLGTGSQDEAIVRSVLRLGQELSLTVIAEGIETEYQSRALRALGCTVGQGFLFGRPVPAEEVFGSGH